MRVSLVALLTLFSLAASCTSANEESSTSSLPSVVVVTPSPEVLPHLPPVTDYSSFKQALKAEGLTVRYAGARTGFLGELLEVPNHRVTIDGKHASVFEYPTEQALDEVRSCISPRGDSVPIGRGGFVSIAWGEPPRFYAAGRLLVLYFGHRQRMFNALERLLGPHFAGGDETAAWGKGIPKGCEPTD